jgi:hypothetical protein
MGNINDETYKKWDEWLDVLGNQIIDLYTQRHIYNKSVKSLRRILQFNSLMTFSFGYLSGTHHLWRLPSGG